MTALFRYSIKQNVHLVNNITHTNRTKDIAATLGWSITFEKAGH